MALTGINFPTFNGTHGTAGAKATSRPTAAPSTPASGNAGGSIASSLDGFSMSSNMALNMAQQMNAMQNSIAKRGATDTQVNRMLTSKGPATATPQDAVKIREELSKMDPGVLKSLADGGTSIRVIGKNENLFEAGLMRPIAPKTFQQNQTADKAATRGVLGGAAAKFDAKIKAAEANLAKATKEQAASQPPTGGGGFLDLNVGQMQNTMLGNLQSQVGLLRAEKEKEIGTGLREATGGRWMEFNPGALASAEKKDMLGGGGAMAQQFMAMQDHQNAFLAKNASLDQMATAHGIKDPKEARQFKDQVYGMNKERVDKARGEALQSLTARARGNTPEAAEARKFLEQVKANPDSLGIPLGLDERPLLVPNNFGTTVKEGGKDRQANMTIHDVGTYHNWSGESGKASNANILGQYFYENGRSEVLVRREELGKPGDYTLTHEVGHAVEEMVKRRAPGFHKGFDKDLRHNHATASPFQQPASNGNSFPSFGGFGGFNGNFGGYGANTGIDGKDPNRKAVSTYAETNSHEFLAEGYAMFTHDPERLKATDAKLYDLIARTNKALGGP